MKEKNGCVSWSFESTQIYDMRKWAFYDSK